MQKINFQNLPSTTTPLNATNLNALQDNVEDVFDGTEPMGNVVVDSIRSKNMINPANLMYNINYNEIIQDFEPTSNWILSGFIPIKTNTSYIYSHSLGTSAGVIDYFDENKTYLGQVNPETITSPFQITNANAKYILVKMFNLNIQNETWQQLEEGTTATTYTPYQELNNQENYSLSEQKIGTWINGKPLYRQTFRFNNIPKGQETVITYNNNMDGNAVYNIDEVVDYKCRWVRLNPDDSFNTFQFGVNVWQMGGNVLGEYSFSCYDFLRQSFVFSVGNMGNFKIDALTLTLEYTKTTD